MSQPIADPWVQGVSLLQQMPVLPGFSWPQWDEVKIGCLTLTMNWIDPMREGGWTVLDAFGVDPLTPSAIHLMGFGIMLGRNTVLEIMPTLARIVTIGGASQTFYRRDCRWAVPIWEVTKETARGVR